VRLRGRTPAAAVAAALGAGAALAARAAVVVVRLQTHAPVIAPDLLARAAVVQAVHADGGHVRTRLARTGAAAISVLADQLVHALVSAGSTVRSVVDQALADAVTDPIGAGALADAIHALLGIHAGVVAGAAVRPVGTEVDAGLTALGLPLGAGGDTDALAAVLAGQAALLALPAVLGVGGDVGTAALANGLGGRAGRLALALLADLIRTTRRDAFDRSVRIQVGGVAIGGRGVSGRAIGHGVGLGGRINLGSRRGRVRVLEVLVGVAGGLLDVLHPAGERQHHPYQDPTAPNGLP